LITDIYFYRKDQALTISETAISHIIIPIIISRIFHALGFSKTGSNNLAPKAKLKKNIKDADTAPLAKAILLLYWDEIDPSRTTVSK